MVTFGVSFEGYPMFPLKRSDNGYLIPDSSIKDLQERHQDALKNQVEIAVEADKLGYEYLSHSEHHSDLLSNVSPNPIVAQTAIARETETIRLLQMANILPWHEPVRLAEQTAMLDVLSDGRLEVGIGRGGASVATETLGQYWGGSSTDETKNRVSFNETYEILLHSWVDNLVSYHGQFHQVPPKHTEWENKQEYSYFADNVSENEPKEYLRRERENTTLKGLPVVPQPQQKPHPQLWRPAMSPQSATWAARRGINICTHVVDMQETAELVDTYYKASEQSGWPDRRPEYDGESFQCGWDESRNRGVGLIISVFNSNIADEETVKRWKRATEYEFLRKGHSDNRQHPIDIDELVESKVVPIVGDATDIIDGISDIIESCELDHAMFLCNVGSIGISYEERLEQLRSVAEDVRPYFEDL